MQTREQASERPAIVRTGDTPLPAAHASGERGVYLRLRFCAFEAVVLFSVVEASRDGLDPNGDNFDDTCPMLLPSFDKPTNQPYFAAQAIRTRRWGTSPGSSGRSARSGTRYPRLRWPCNARAAEGLPEKRTGSETQTRKSAPAEKIARFRLPVQSIPLTHSHACTRTQSHTDTLRSVSASRKDTSKQKGRSQRTAPGQAETLWRNVYVSRGVVLYFRGVHGRHCNR